MIDPAIKFFIYLHNFSYRILSLLVVRSNNGIHPKHHILKYYDFFLSNISLKDRVLDIGCGNGYVTYILSKKAREIVGIDINKDRITKAKHKYSKARNIHFIFGDARNYDFQDKFDVIVLSNVLEHIKDRVQFLSKLKSFAPKFLIRVPLLSRDWLTVYKKERGLEYRLDPSHHVEYTEEIFKMEIRQAGLNIMDFYTRFGELYGIISQDFKNE